MNDEHGDAANTWAHGGHEDVVPPPPHPALIFERSGQVADAADRLAAGAGAPVPWRRDSGRRAKAVILYLARNLPRDISDLKLSLRLLDWSFNRRYGYPVVIFHEDFGPELMREIEASTTSRIRFEKIVFEVPSFLTAAEIARYTADRSLGYRHMGRFFSGPIYDHPALQEFEWYWRLDTDSFLLTRIDRDMFVWMEGKGFEYAYNSTWREFDRHAGSLWATTAAFCEDRGELIQNLRTYIPDGVWKQSVFATNFEIASFALWRSRPYRDYLHCLEASGDMYTYRWGDGVIHTLAVLLFLSKHKVVRVRGIGYNHQQIFHLPLGWREVCGLAQTLPRVIVRRAPMLVKRLLSKVKRP